MGDRLGTPGVVDFKFFSQILIKAVVAATSNGGSNLRTFDRYCRRSQIKKSKLNLVTSFKVGFHFFFGFRLSYLGGRGFYLQMKQLHCKLRTLHCSVLFSMAKLREIGMRPVVRLYWLSTAIPR